MADGDSGIAGTVAEAVVKPVKDEIGQIIEVAGQSITGKTPSPQQTQQKLREDQVKMADAQRRINWWKQLSAQQQAVRNEKKQVVVQQDSEKKQEAKIKQFEIVQKKQDAAVRQREEIARTRQESGKGHGVGG